MTTEMTDTVTATTEEQLPKRGRKPAEVEAEPKVESKPDPMELVEVIVQKPFGTSDSHAFFGFNGVEGQYAYDKPVKMPRAMVEYLRSARSVEFRPDETGAPKASYVNTYSIIDVRK